jgi:antitoxin CptB
MKNQDLGFITQNSADGSREQILHPASCNFNPDLLQRVRWRCRRGLLELDIILGRFVEAHYSRLSLPERETFEQFLDMADNPLWDMISGKMNTVSNEQTALLEKIRSV